MRAAWREPRAIALAAIVLSSATMLGVLWASQPALAISFLVLLASIALLWRRSVQSALAATRLALTDPLTGLGNRRHFYDRLHSELTAAAGSGRPVGLCVLDVDGLKRVNDTQGHEAGDRLLEQVAACLRHGGEAFRVGGDEFALLLRDRDVDAAREVAEAVVARVAEFEGLNGEGARVSAGVAVFPMHCERDELYRCADEALYASKRAGRSEVVVYAPPQPPEIRSVSGA